MNWHIETLTRADIPAATALFNQSIQDGEMIFSQLDEQQFEQRFFQTGAHAFAAKANGGLVGFIHGACKTVYLNKENNENTPGYLSVIVVRKNMRRQGIGAALLGALEDAFRTDGKKKAACNDGTPAQMNWTIPGTPEHDHNNAPGVAESCEGYGFLIHQGYDVTFVEVAMYLDLKQYKWNPALDEKIAKLAEEGIRVGRWTPDCGTEHNELCDHVGSEYWRHVLDTELAAWLENRPNEDASLWPDGRKPAGPRPLLTATTGGHIVAYTGPVDLQESGRGWFTGICCDPNYGGKGIASVLFNQLMQEFVEEGAQFSTLFTGETNFAQKIYSRAGFRIVARFDGMAKVL